MRKPLSEKSIAQITYPADDRPRREGGLEWASGFFAETEQFGRVCITCAHVFHDHPGKDRQVVLVNGYPARLLLDAWQDFGVDIAVVEVPEPLQADAEISYHSLGVATTPHRVYYCHGWSPVAGTPGVLELVKIWGPRLPGGPVRAPQAGRRAYTVWRLRNDVPDDDSGLAFSTKNFQRGWSGAPVFNVRRRMEDDRVVGVLSVVQADGRAGLAVSVEKLDFLRPADPQQDEGRLVRIERGWIDRLLPGRRNGDGFEIVFQDTDRPPTLYEARFQEITNLDVSPPVPPPRSPYDQLG